MGNTGIAIAEKKYAPLESRQRLSESRLWKWQRSFFEGQGMAAWRRGTVPHHITSCPFVAEAYARMVFGFLRDCRASLDSASPVYLVELGAGPGRLAYLLLKKLQSLLGTGILGEIRVRYVMTDFAQANVDAWRAHPWLQPFFDAGLLDVCRFDAECDEEFTLLISGEKVSAATVRNPVVSIANYVFDGLPQDAFHVGDDELHEALVTLSLPGPAGELEAAELLSRAEVSYEHQPAPEGYYPEPEWNALLDGYRRRFRGAEFLFPIAALRCIRSLHSLSGGRLLMLSADGGYSRDEAVMAGRGTLAITRHGSISMMVDYQLLGEYVESLAGAALHPAHRHESLNISAFLLGEDTSYPETRLAYDETVGQFGPDDFAQLKDGVERLYDALTLPELLAFLRLSAWDHKRFWNALPALRRGAEASSPGQRLEILNAVRATWDHYLPLGEEDDLAFQMGTLLLKLEFYPEALEFFEHSLALYGEEPGTVYNVAACYYGMQQTQQALTYSDRALVLYPGFEEATGLRSAILSQMMETAEPAGV